MKVESLVDFDDIELDLNDELDIDSNSDLNQAFNSLSNPYLEWAKENACFLFRSTQDQLVFKFYLEFKDKISFDGVESFNEHFLECRSICIYYLDKVLKQRSKELTQKELIQKELDSFLKPQMIIGKTISVEEYQLELKRKHELIKSDLEVLNLIVEAIEWVSSKHEELYNTLDNPKVSNHDFNKLFKSAIKWDLKQNERGVLKDSLMPYLESMYIRMVNTFREYSIQKNRLTLLSDKNNKHSPLKSKAINAVGASKSDYNRVANNATGSTATSKRVKLSLPACSKPAQFQTEHSISDLPYDSPLRDSPLIKVLRKRQITP